MERGKGFYVSALGTVSTHLGCLVPPVGVNTLHYPDDHFYINHVFWDDTVEVMKAKVTVGIAVEIHSGKVSTLSDTVSWVLEAKMN